MAVDEEERDPVVQEPAKGFDVVSRTGRPGWSIPRTAARAALDWRSDDRDVRGDARRGSGASQDPDSGSRDGPRRDGGPALPGGQDVRPGAVEQFQQGSTRARRASVPRVQ